ncbi:MAG: cryptochrome/photolyase family protein [Flavobacterium sp. BFFFF1]|uniref:cryptochrome/photolyase family protein n=1 Tax=Flavobacterium sp. BFFFF1 TaxID=2015557 RepID=UPI000BD76496|nr:cryptochrome/photolyase family protein [Flavobacterium sp. BFFFF1]OYU79923.1 MAG: cryptochrome/photolyase family protein [Flavobacterium sp. BFFFF1]
MKVSRTLRLVLGDQLNSRHSWFDAVDDSVTYVMMEVRTETDYALHHIQKVVGFFVAMRGFSESLSAAGHHVVYFSLDDPANRQSIPANLQQLLDAETYTQFEYQYPDEYRVDVILKDFCAALPIAWQAVETEHFYTRRETLADFFAGKKTLLMESFYREMRRKHGVLMDCGQLLTGQWNYDEDNRKKLPREHRVTPPLVFDNDVSPILSAVNATDINTIGTIDARHFVWPVNREQSLQLLDFFVEACLPLFGSYQDAMVPQQWSLYHSRLSFSMNTKMLAPAEVIDAAVAAWQANPDAIAYHQLEGFVRQIIGWREYMRGIYWMKMPEFGTLNFLDHQAPLPEWYWTGKTKMHCLRDSIGQSLQWAYAHHIQRLMVTGNFALLAGVAPDAVDGWYLGIYIDALEWVEITNTRGMSQFADGGIVGTKPYVSSAAYIDRMSHYCGTCYYNKAKKTGDKACPFNSLYWNFYDRHRDKLERSPRIGMVYKLWDRMKQEDKAALLEQATFYLTNIDKL